MGGTVLSGRIFTDRYTFLRTLVRAGTMASIPLLALGTLKGIGDTLVPLDLCLVFELLLESTKRGWECASDGGDDIVLWLRASSGKLCIHRVSERLGI